MRTPRAKHNDTYQHDCPACIADPREAATDSLLQEHQADVLAIRDGSKLPPGPAKQRTPDYDKEAGAWLEKNVAWHHFDQMTERALATKFRQVAQRATKKALKGAKP